MALPCGPRYSCIHCSVCAEHYPTALPASFRVRMTAQAWLGMSLLRMRLGDRMACGSLPGLKAAGDCWRSDAPLCCVSAPLRRFERFRLLPDPLLSDGRCFQSGWLSAGRCFPSGWRSDAAAAPSVGAPCTFLKASRCRRSTTAISAALPVGRALPLRLLRRLGAASAASVTSRAICGTAAAAKCCRCTEERQTCCCRDAGDGCCGSSDPFARLSRCCCAKSESEIRCVILLACKLLVLLLAVAP
jgi:hypothetical protein